MKKIFKLTLIETCKKTSIYILFFFVIMLTIAFSFIFPRTEAHGQFGPNSSNFDDYLFSGTMALPPLCFLVSAWTAESMAKNTDIIFILSSPIKRKQYYLGKLLASLLVVFILWLLLILIVIIGRVSLKTSDDYESRMHIKQYVIYCFMLLFSLLAGQLFASSLCYYIKNGVLPIVGFLTVFFIEEITSVLISNAGITTKILIYDFFSIIYAPIFSLSIISAISGIFLFSRKDLKF